MNRTDILSAVKPLVEVFESLGISYYIGGSVASSVYGMARATMDVDIVADLKVQHVRTLVEILESSYYIDESMILDAINERTSFNIIHLETMLKVDIFVLKNAAYHQLSLQRRRKDTLPQDSSEFYFVSAEDIILSKLDWYRMSDGVSERQWNDVLGVLKVQHKSLDIAYLEHWARKLRLDDLLYRAFDEAGIEV